MSKPKLPAQFLKQLQQVTGKRSRIVVDHILKYGFITTEDIEQIYGYKHPPRAVKDVRDQGIPIETYSVKSSDGRTIAAYRFGDPSKVVRGRLGGRSTLPRRFKRTLYKNANGKCAICDGQFRSSELQVDHKVPYEIAGDVAYEEKNIGSFMLLCGSCNRTKSWACEHCPNWTKKDISVCKTCYWSEPITYLHVATQKVRRTEIQWEGDDETNLHDQIAESAGQSQQSVQAYIKTLLRNIFHALLINF